jgi:hypothetical protein
MTLQETLRAARLQQSHAKFLQAAQRYPTLYHIAMDARTATCCLRKDPAWCPDQDHRYTTPIGIKPFEGMQPDFLPEIDFFRGGAPAIGKLIGRMNLLKFDAADWYGCFHIRDQATADAHAGITLLRKLCDEVAYECFGPSLERIYRDMRYWLGPLYDLFADCRYSDHAAPLKHPYRLAWLPGNVFLCSAGAIEIWAAKERPRRVMSRVNEETAEQKRPAYGRDHRWLEWNLTSRWGVARIRDHWDSLSQRERVDICPTACEPVGGETPELKRSGYEVVKSGLRKAKREKQGGT